MHMRVFEKDGHRVTTSSPAAAVNLKARGYAEILDEPGPQVSGRAVAMQQRAASTPSRPPSDERDNAPD
jgi:hypothetical protein